MDLESAKMRLRSLATLGGSTAEAVELVLVRLAELDGAEVTTEYGVRFASGRTAARISVHAARWSADMTDESEAVQRTVLTARTEWAPVPPVNGPAPTPERRWQDVVGPDVATYVQQVRTERGLPADPYANQDGVLEIVQLADRRASGGDR